MWAAFRGALSFRKDPRGEILLGCGVALFMVCLHSLYEWVLITSPLLYLLGINMGLIAALTLKTSYRGRRQVRSPRADAIVEPKEALQR
jgi:hypothetical protein